MTALADRMIDGVRRMGSPLCIGLDPFPDRIPALFGDARTDANAVAAFGEAIIALAAQHAAVLKPQVGLFEPYGYEGVRVATELTAVARAVGMTVILDAKRGDIGTTAEGYARATLGPAPGYDADCVTVNPYMGLDTLEPYLAIAEKSDKGGLVLVRTSNPGARDMQDWKVGNAPLWARTAEMIAPLAARLKGSSGWSGLMAVVGATYPDEARSIRALLPESLFLVPGYGAQGASAQEAVAGFVVKNGVREGGVVSSSRAVLYPPAAQAAKTLTDWRAAIAAAMTSAKAELRAACAA
jgi:orotidine-5'-phosphate decarboxylase